MKLLAALQKAQSEKSHGELKSVITREEFQELLNTFPYLRHVNADVPLQDTYLKTETLRETRITSNNRTLLRKPASGVEVHLKF